MPTTNSTARQFGREVSQNVRRGPNMTIDERNIAIGMLDGGCSTAEVAAAFHRDPSTIRRLHQKYSTTATTADKPRSGRPTILSRHQKKLIYRAARRAPKIEYKDLIKAATIVQPDGTPSRPPSKSTLYRMLRRLNIVKYRCRKRPKLTPQHARKRLQFARRYRHFPWRRRTVKFSDECSVQKSSYQEQEWCFRYPVEKWKARMITQVTTGKIKSQMVWGAIWLDERGHGRRSPLVIMERDTDAAGSGYTSQSYIQALRKGLLPSYRTSQLFVQDNARIHTSRAVRTFLADHQITTLDWPAYSPDLNPIEHLWWQLKRRMNKFYPQYNNYSETQEQWDGFCYALKDCWRRIPRRRIEQLITSMPRRLGACRAARGWQTKY